MVVEMASGTVTNPLSAWAEVRETHSGVVLLLGDRAYKFKKPVDLGFLDFTTVERRRQACHREVQLNRRLAPDVYLGLGDLVGPDGRPVDHVVMMRRMPDERRLSRLVESGADVTDELRAVARRLAVFHAEATPVSTPPDTVTVDSLRTLWEASFDGLRSFTPSIVATEPEAALEALVGRYLDGRADLFERRRTTGSVVDGHGDLLAEDIFCLDDGPRILDCLEFDDRLRTVDQVDDAAFLAMDLERLGAPELARRFLDLYAEFSGGEAPSSLVHHYVAYRAFVRAKVACLRSAQGHVPSAGEARSLIDLALSHLEQSAVKLVLVGGPPGTGKSTLAAALADRLGMTMLSSDRIRKELAGLSPTASAAAPLGAGIYTEEWSRQVYEELMRRAALLLRLGESVVVDCTWARESHRQLALRAAGASRADLVELQCEAPLDVVRQRVLARGGVVSTAGTRSDAGVAVAEAVSGAFDLWESAQVVATDRSLEESVSNAATLVRPRGPRAVDGRRSFLEPG